MPELPEVEVTRRGIAGPLRGARVVGVRVGKPLRWPLGKDETALAGATVGDVGRRGKYLWLPLHDAGQEVIPPPGLSSMSVIAAAAAVAVAAEPPASGDAGAGSNAGRGGLLLHLGMSGSLSLLSTPPDPGPHDHFDLVTDRGTLRLNDPRRFGAVVWSAAIDAAPASTLLGRLGTEPFDPVLTPASFHAALQRRAAPIKAVLLAGVVVVGAGNIYACEALFRAGIHPALSARRISRPRAERLLMALRATLTQALDLGGSTLRDFTDAHGVSGAYQSGADVYGREGLPCRRCTATIRRVVQAQRSTWFCPVCQKR